jgi:hypothetical protein
MSATRTRSCASTFGAEMRRLAYGFVADRTRAIEHLRRAADPSTTPTAVTCIASRNCTHCSWRADDQITDTTPAAWLGESDTRHTCRSASVG